MRNVLEDLYFGEVKPNSFYFKSNQNILECERKVDGNEKVLLERLEADDKKLFLEYLDAQGELEANYAVENFIDGFKLGVKIIIESVS